MGVPPGSSRVESPPLLTEPAPGILTFIAADVFGFVLLFLVFMVQRSQSPAIFSTSAATLEPAFGLLDTAILVTSGWLVALSLAHVRAGDSQGARRRLIQSLAVGLGFGVSKAVEYSHAIGRGLTPLTNDFYTFYYVLTGLHLLHYAIGVAVLGVMLAMTARGKPDADYIRWMRSGALYWHMVDLLWIFIFPVLYLQRAGAP